VIFRRNIDNYPDSPNVYDSLGDALLAAADSTGARTEFTKARDVAIRLGRKPSEATMKKIEGIEHATQAGKARP
jgi:hypothetical protein